MSSLLINGTFGNDYAFSKKSEPLTEKQLKGRLYREKNRESIRISAKKYREDNRHILLPKKKEYRETHKEQISAYNRRYNQGIRFPFCTVPGQRTDENKQKMSEIDKKLSENDKKLSLPNEASDLALNEEVGVSVSQKLLHDFFHSEVHPIPGTALPKAEEPVPVVSKEQFLEELKIPKLPPLETKQKELKCSTTYLEILNEAGIDNPKYT